MAKHLSSLLSLVMLAAAPSFAEDSRGNWIQLRSSHFTVVTDGGEKEGRRTAAQFERMRALFQDLYPQWDFDSESPVVVLALKSQDVFRTLQPDAYLAKDNLKLRGWYLSGSGKRYILMRIDLKGGDPFPVAFHEYTHLVLDEAIDSVPLWLDEGLAEFYANTKTRNETLLFGKANRYYLKLLRNEKRFPLSTLFGVDENSPYYVNKESGSVFYAESWALVQYLTLKDYEDKTTNVGRYLELIGEKVDPLTAAVQAFGDLKKLEKALDFHIQRENTNHVEMTSSAKIEESEFEAASITSIQAEAVQADFLACSGRFEEARAVASRVLQQDPENSSAQATVKFLDSAELSQAEEKLRSAIQTIPPSAAAYDQLAVFLWKRGKDLDEAKRLSSKAVSLDTGNLNFRIDLANILLSAEEDQAAIKTLRDAAPLAKTPEETATLDRQLRDAEKYASERAARNKTTGNKALTSENEASESAPSSSESGFIPGGPHRFVVGVLKGVHCDAPALDLTVTSQAGTVSLHTDNYFQVQFTALIAPTRDLQPCSDLENKAAKVEYVESRDGQVTPRLIAVELRR